MWFAESLQSKNELYHGEPLKQTGVKRELLVNRLSLVCQNKEVAMVIGILILVILLPVALVSLVLKTSVQDNELDEMGMCLARPQSMMGSEVPIRLSAVLLPSADHS
jgi:hypothetical protein